MSCLKKIHEGTVGLARTRKSEDGSVRYCDVFGDMHDDISFDNKYLDTKPLAKTLQSKKGWKNVKLTYLSEYYHVEQSEAHRAWCDAEANAYVYLKLKQEII